MGAPAARCTLAVLVGPFVVFPFVTNEGNLFRYGLITVVYALLALGLNVVVGFAGLLDLGYVAFFGFGAYLYGIMASGHSGHHLQAEIAIPIVVVATALLGLLLGLTSWRLLGDYLAIVTLFFLQAFVIFVNNANGGPSDFSYPFVGRVDLTGGANGLDQIDPLNFFGSQDHDDEGLLLVHARCADAPDDDALLRQQVSNGAILARAARGPARSGGHDRAGQPVEVARVHVRCRHRGLHGDDLRRRAVRRVPG